jgi:hypothetical protein
LAFVDYLPGVSYNVKPSVLLDGLATGRPLVCGSTQIFWLTINSILPLPWPPETIVVTVRGRFTAPLCHIGCKRWSVPVPLNGSLVRVTKHQERRGLEAQAPMVQHETGNASTHSRDGLVLNLGRMPDRPSFFRRCGSTLNELISRNRHTCITSGSAGRMWMRTQAGKTSKLLRDGWARP